MKNETNMSTQTTTPERPYTVFCKGVSTEISPIVWAVSRNAAMAAARKRGLAPVSAVERFH